MDNGKQSGNCYLGFKVGVTGFHGILRAVPAPRVLSSYLVIMAAIAGLRVGSFGMRDQTL